MKWLFTEHMAPQDTTVLGPLLLGLLQVSKTFTAIPFFLTFNTSSLRLDRRWSTTVVPLLGSPAKRVPRTRIPRGEMFVGGALSSSENSSGCSAGVHRF
jgi:hypothetical protein